MRAYKGVDFSAYGRSVVMLFRFPQLIVGPLVAGLVLFGISSTFSVSPGSGIIGQANAGIFSLVAQLINGFGLSLALIGADAAWRRNRAPLGEAWDEASRRIGDIFFAAIGFSFVIFMGSLVGGFLGGLGALVLSMVAFFFFVYTLPAATIGGVPGSAALQVSLERAKANPIPTLFITILYLLTSVYLPSFVVGLLLPLLVSVSFLSSGIVASLLVIVVGAIFSAYLALVLAHLYAALSFGRRW